MSECKGFIVFKARNYSCAEVTVKEAVTRIGPYTAGSARSGPLGSFVLEVDDPKWINLPGDELEQIASDLEHYARGGSGTDLIECVNKLRAVAGRLTLPT